MRIAWIIAGLVFLFNPNVNLIDILPDALGWGFILYGLLPVSRAPGKIGEACARAGRLFVLSLVKIPAFFLCMLLANGDALMLLIGSLVFGVLEILFSLPFAASFFEGVEPLAKNARGAKIMTYVFFIIKPLFCVLPDLTLLSDSEHGVVGADGIMNLQRYRWPFTVLAAAAVLIVGIVWLSLLVAALRRAKKDAPFVKSQRELAARLAAEESASPFRRLALAMSFAFAAALFLLEFKVEGYSLIPPMVAPVLFFLSLWLMKKEFAGQTLALFGGKKQAKGEKLVKGGLVAAGVWFALSTLAWILAYRFTDAHYNGLEDAGLGFSESIAALIERSFELRDELVIVTVAASLAALAAFLFFLIIKWLCDHLIEHYAILPEGNLAQEDKSEAIRQHEAAELAAIQTPLRKMNRWFLPLAALSCLSNGLFPWIQVQFPPFFTIDLILRVIFAAFLALYASRLRQAMKNAGGLLTD